MVVILKLSVVTSSLNQFAESQVECIDGFGLRICDTYGSGENLKITKSLSQLEEGTTEVFILKRKPSVSYLGRTSSAE